MKNHLFAILMLFATSLEGTASDDDRRESSPNFKDGIFHNTNAQLNKKTVWDTILMRLTTDWADWPDWVEVAQGEPPLERVYGDETQITFINHSTFLIQTGGYNILTDPVYSLWCGPIDYIGVKRVHQPAIAFDDLPKIDVVLISHDHYDHLDLDTIDDLVNRDDPRIYVGLGVADHLDSTNQVTELDWWDSAHVAPNFKVTFAETQHSSGRILIDRYETLWGGFVLEINDKKIYFGGDSGYSDHYIKTFQRFGPMDISLLPIGAYAPRYSMKNDHLDPAEAIQAHLELQSKKSIGMHYGTFQLTAEEWDEPPLLLESEKIKASIPVDDFVTLELGEPLTLE